MTLTLQEAKDRVTIESLWREFGFKGDPKKTCRCPFHEDRSPSFSVFDDGKKWKCFKGCGEGSVIDFLALAKGISEDEACVEIVERAGGKKSDSTPAPRRESKKPSKPEALELPPLREYSKQIAQAVADSRGLNITAVEFACHWLKTIVFAKVFDAPSWILTDASGRCAEARRIDCKPYPAIGDLPERKSHTLAGSSKRWPVGILPAGFEEDRLRQHCHKILLVEGGPDYLAACQLIAAEDVNILPVAMLGASQNIAPDALPYFHGRRVTILAHPDDTGRDAAVRWRQQIKGAGGLVKAIQLKKHDLNDLVISENVPNALDFF